MKALDAPTPSASDHALLLAFRAWRVLDHDLPWSQFSPPWSATLKASWGGQYAEMDPELAWATLSRLHSAEAIYDADRVHWTWRARALQGESPSVQRAVLANAPTEFRDRIAGALSLTREDLTPDGPILPEALAWSQSFWAERLVGGPPPGVSDPTVVVAIASLSLKELTRLIRESGRAKLRVIDRSEDSGDYTETWFGLAREDRESCESKPTCVRLLRDLGLLTFSRLLNDVDPFRSRWTLQHLPYPAAKLFRMRSDVSPVPMKNLVEFENTILRSAWRQLFEEGRLSIPWGISS